MNRKLLSLAFVAFAGAVAATSGMAKQEDRAEKIFARLDIDKSGDLSLAEFSAMMRKRLAMADTDKDGKMTVGEIAASFKVEETDPRATNFLRRFDINKDGTVTMAEVDQRRKVRFTRLDSDDDGKLVLTEFKTTGGGATGKGAKPKAATE